MTDPIVTALKAERKARGLSLQQLGELLGRKTYNTPWQWENGVKNSPTLPNLREWAAALGYDLALIPREPDDPPPAIVTIDTGALL